MTEVNPLLDFTFTCTWKAEVLSARPVILPARHFVYPRDVEEVERGALEVLVEFGDELCGVDLESRSKEKPICQCHRSEKKPSVTSMNPLPSTLSFSLPIIPTTLTAPFQ